MKSRVMLLDTDMIMYPALYKATSEQDFDGEILGPYVDQKVAQGFVNDTINDLMLRAKCDQVICALSDHGGNWRKVIYPNYKKNRTGGKPMGWKQLETYIRNTYEWCAAPLCEADDVLGILATGTHKGSCVVVSGDKDLLTIPGLYMDTKGTRRPRRVTRRQADVWHLKQALIGDQVDDYPGCPGIGKVNADRIIEEASAECPRWSKAARDHCWQAVLATYLKAYEKLDNKGLAKEDKTEMSLERYNEVCQMALVQAQIARICRATEWDTETQEVILWS